MENLTTLIDLQKAFDKINHKILFKKCLSLVCQLSQLLRLNLTSEVIDFKLLSKNKCDWFDDNKLSIHFG